MAHATRSFYRCFALALRKNNGSLIAAAFTEKVQAHQRRDQKRREITIYLGDKNYIYLQTLDLINIKTIYF